jgi:uncharacterized surface protein with fasciclin (FAS1) repeats
MEQRSFQTRRTMLFSLFGAALLSVGSFSSCEDYDLDEKLPPGFGSTLYSYLDENNYTDFARLIRDLGYEEALSGRSSKTMFVADDEAFARFYANNKWGVHNYEELSTAQKKLLLYSAMIDNSLQIMSLSSTSGNSGLVEGNCMRRSTAASAYDTVPIIYPSEMPDNASAWRYYRENNKPIVCMKDMTTAPVVFFVEKFLTKNRITNEDVDFVFNHTTHRASGDAGVNGLEVVESNIRCANGFLHRLDDVLLPLDNMSEIIRTKPQTQIYSRLLERFSAPYYIGRDATLNYNNTYGTQVDSVFQKRYFASRSADGQALETLPDGTAVKATLKFDPGWNSFFSDDPNAASNTIAMQENMGVMLVPTDAALQDYWENGTGKVLRDYYGSWDAIPDNVIAKLINNNMLNSFINSVPSKFDGIVNSTQDAMGITTDDVDSVFLGCNGAIYLTNKVFSPTEYVSVSFPALINQTMNIFYWAIEQLQYGSYLNSLDSYYSLFIPDNQSMLTYVDPVSFGETKTRIYKFYYKEEAETEEERVWASSWEYDIETGVVGDSIEEITYIGTLKNRLQDLLDNHIVVGNIESGKHYYRTKNGGVVRVTNEGGIITAVEGTYQMDRGRKLQILSEDIYDESEEGNGKSYIVRDEPVMTTNKSVFDILEEHDEYSVFNDLLQGSELHEMSRNNSTIGSKNGNISAFNNYHYTVYVPTNESLNALIASGDLPTWEQIGVLENDPNVSEEYVDSLSTLINEFVRYHVQDNSVYLDMDYSTDGGSDDFTRNYETSIMNLTTNKFYTLAVHVQPDKITVTDAVGHERHVLTDNPELYNLSAREYQFSGSSLSTSAFAVVHPIDGPLFFKSSQCVRYDRQNSKQAIR